MVVATPSIAFAEVCSYLPSRAIFKSTSLSNISELCPVMLSALLYVSIGVLFVCTDESVTPEVKLVLRLIIENVLSGRDVV